MNASRRDQRAQDFGLFFLRVSAGLFLLWVHGLPKLLNYSTQLQIIEDPFHLGTNVTLMLAIFAEVLCPLLIVAGIFVRWRAFRSCVCCWSRCWLCIRNGASKKGSSVGCC